MKQGDPLTPLVYNLIIEPIVANVQQETTGIEVEGVNVAAVVSADDMRKQMAIVYKFLEELGMKLSLKKIMAFEYAYVPR